MISWFALWPLLVVPYVAMVALGVLPQGEFFHLTFGGGQVRQWCVNTLVLSWLPALQGEALVAWYAQASWAEEVGLHALIVLHVYGVVFPFFYALGQWVIRLSAWTAAGDLASKRRAVKAALK